MNAMEFRQRLRGYSYTTKKKISHIIKNFTKDELSMAFNVMTNIEYSEEQVLNKLLEIKKKD